MSLIKEAITEYFGPRCPDHEPECIVCQAWAEYDAKVCEDIEDPSDYVGMGWVDSSGRP